MREYEVGTSNAFLRRLPKGAFWNLPTKQEEDDQTGDFASPAHTALEVVGKQVQKLQQSREADTFLCRSKDPDAAWLLQVLVIDWPPQEGI